VQADELRGAVLLVARHGQVVLFESVGWRDTEARLPMETTTLFRMASNTKPVIATAVLILAQDGALHLDDPVSRFVPEFGEGDLARITIHHLLTNTSGLPRGPIFLQPMGEGTSLLREAARFARELELEREPGTGYGYSNVGFNVLGAVIEVASGMELADFLRTRIYEPLEMVDTNNHESTADHSRMARVYRRDGEWRVSWAPGDEPSFPIVRASGGMISTAADYANFLQMWLNGGRFGDRQLLSPAAVALATRPHTRELLPPAEGDGAGGYGYGWQVLPDGRFGHGGSDGTFAWVDPELDLIGIVFTQSPGGGNPRDEFMERIRRAVVD
jgi:CubicO group peptidase (beta-lactamase class C family)